MADEMGKLLNLHKMFEKSRKFVEERDWGCYHTPKNIAMGIVLESAELMEIFQWLNEKQSFEVKNNKEQKERVSDEVGDIFHYLIRLATLLDIDIEKAFWDKIKKTEEKYPPKLVKGKKEKYSDYVK